MADPVGLLTPSSVNTSVNPSPLPSQTIVPPNTSVAAPSSLLQMPPLNLPEPAPSDSGSSLVAAATSQPPTQASPTPALDAATQTPAATGSTPSPSGAAPVPAQPTPADPSQDPNVVSAQSGVNAAEQGYASAASGEPTAAGLLASAQGANGVATDVAQVNDLTTQLASATAEYNQASQDAQTQGINSGTPSVFYQGQQAAIQRQKAVVVGGISARLAAAQGNYTRAEALAEKTAALQFSDAQNKVAQMEKFVTMNQSNLTAAEKISVAKISANAKAQAQQLTAQKANVKFALTNGVTSQFYTDPSGAVVRTQDGYAFSSPQEAFSAGVLPDYSNAPRVMGVGKSETKNINGQLVHVTYDSTNQNVVKTTDLGPSGTPKAGDKGTPKTTTSEVAAATNAFDSALQKGSPDGKNPGIGTDGYANPATYNALRANWQAQGYDVKTFDSQYGKYINPANQAAYQGAKVKAPAKAKAPPAPPAGT